MKQLRFPPPWGPRLIDLLTKLRQERKEGVKVNYHFCGVPLLQRKKIQGSWDNIYEGYPRCRVNREGTL